MVTREGIVTKTELKGASIMKAAVLEQAQQPMVIKDIPVPSIGDNEVLIQVRACGVCHTDLHIAEGFLSGFGLDPFPLVMGHEIVGEVDQIGAGVNHLTCGERVGAYWTFGCGHCQCCLSGKEQTCTTNLSSGNFQAAGMTLDGGYAEYVKVGAEYAIPLPEELDFVDAAPFLCAGLTTYAGFKNAVLRPGQRAAVLGIGGLGHMAIPIAVAMGAEVIAITSTEAKMKLAKELGAHYTINATGPEIGQKLLEIGGVDVVLSTTVDAQVIGCVLQALLPQGALVLAGLTTAPLPVVPAQLVAFGQRIIGTNIGSRLDYQELLHLAVQNDIRPITETYALDEVNEVHERLRANQVRFRAILTPN
jgi:D-arabinose 1-dehydrogenase-like Zn-dependent alcohol dehydrogenase